MKEVMFKSNEELYYENNVELWKKELFLENEHQLKRFSTLHDLIPHSVTSILDVGCGNGAFFAYLEERNMQLKLMGLERSKIGNNMVVCHAPVHNGTIEQIPYGDNSFDLISALEVIEHLPFGVYETGLKEIERVAKDYILISVPYKESRIKAICPYCQCKFNPDYHMREFDENSMKTLFNKFVQIAEAKVYIDDYWFLPFFRRLKWRFSKQWLPNFLCPQCGFHQSNSRKDSNINFSKGRYNNMKKIAKKMTPHKKLPFWLISLYQKK